ncbi:MAG: membrane protein insertase YidC, partial [Elusimicrobia bacterium]|nr:membrane protein insertase YidC [Elusimicrobiota bacterium]
MNRNLILAFVLSGIVYLGWFFWFERNYKAKQPPVLPQTSEQTAAIPAQANQEPLKQILPLKTAQLPLSELALFKTPKADIKFNPQGAAIASYVFYGPTGPVELVPYQQPGFFGTMPETVFRLKNKTDDFISFSAQPAKNVEIEKTYFWDKSEGLSRLEIKILNNSNKVFELPEWDISFGPGIGTVKSEQSENPKVWQAAYAVSEQGKKNPVLKNLSKIKPSQSWLWAGVMNRYFIAAAIPDKWENYQLNYSETEIKEKVKAPSLSIPVAKLSLAPGQTKTWSLNYYFGPKDYRKLVSLGHGLDRSVELGMFSPLAKIAMSVLYFNYKVTKNYGWSI